MIRYLNQNLTLNLVVVAMMYLLNLIVGGNTSLVVQICFAVIGYTTARVTKTKKLLLKRGRKKEGVINGGHNHSRHNLRCFSLFVGW